MSGIASDVDVDSFFFTIYIYIFVLLVLVKLSDLWIVTVLFLLFYIHPCIPLTHIGFYV